MPQIHIMLCGGADLFNFTERLLNQRCRFILFPSMHMFYGYRTTARYRPTDLKRLLAGLIFRIHLNTQALQVVPQHFQINDAPPHCT